MSLCHSVSMFQDLSGKMVGVWFPISMFIAIGFEHSVANMFILPAGLFSGPSQTCRISCLSDACRPEKVLIYSLYYVSRCYSHLVARCYRFMKLASCGRLLNQSRLNQAGGYSHVASIVFKWHVECLCVIMFQYVSVKAV